VKFDELVKTKNDILSKIDEKNERIKTIIEELGVNMIYIIFSINNNFTLLIINN